MSNATVTDPLRFTTARWCNRLKDDGKWSKVLMHTGPYSQYGYGTDTTDPGKFRHRYPGGADGPAQVALICTAESGVFAIDVDHPEVFGGSATARHVSAADAISVRGDHFHILCDARHLREQFPRMGAATWGDIKARGFVPLPGSVHGRTGAMYSRGPGLVVAATPGLIEAVMADRLACAPGRSGGSGSGTARAGAYDHDTARAAVVLRGLLAGKDEAVICAEWCAAPDHGPECSSSRGFTSEDFARHLGGGRRKAAEILTREAAEAAWQAAMMSQLTMRGTR